MEDRLLRSADELVPNVAIKQEPQWLAEGLDTTDRVEFVLPDGVVKQEVVLPTDSLHCIKTEKQPIHAEVPMLPVQLFAQTDEYIKTELILDEKTIVPKSDALTTTPVLLPVQKKPKRGSKNGNDESARVSIAGEEFEICASCYKLYPKGCSEAHFRQGNCKNQYECKLCPRSFRDKRIFDRHSATHVQETFQCQLCPRYFMEKATLARHSRVHSQKKYKCALCPLSFKVKNSLTRHNKIHNENPRENYTCEYCALEFLYEKSLNRHLVTHTKKKKPVFDCNACEKTFDTKDGLSKHMELHADDSHVCDKCGECFWESGDLKQHILERHKWNEALECEFCETSFQSELDRNAHTCSQLFKCDFCPMSYANKYARAVHNKEHTVWKCGICEKKFNKEIRTREHIMRDHKVTVRSKVNELVQKTPTA